MGDPGRLHVYVDASIFPASKHQATCHAGIGITYRWRSRKRKWYLVAETSYYLAIDGTNTTDLEHNAILLAIKLASHLSKKRAIIHSDNIQAVERARSLLAQPRRCLEQNLRQALAKMRVEICLADRSEVSRAHRLARRAAIAGRQTKQV